MSPRLTVPLLNRIVRFSTRSSSSSSASSSSAAASSSSSSSSSPPKTNSINPDEIALFSSLSSEWWNASPTAEFSLLHRMNPARVKFVKESILRVHELETENGGRWLKGKEVLDVGCGGGIFAEALARLGATTLAVDAAGVNIGIAQSHATLDPSFVSSSASDEEMERKDGIIRNSLTYRHCAAEDLVTEKKQFDVVCAMEVIEHVDDPKGFLDCLSDLTKPGGLLLLSTISRTPLSHLLDITIPESLLRIITPGTHTYSKFIKPSELQAYFEEKGWTGMQTRGCLYNPILGEWHLLNEGNKLGEQANYFAGVRKPLL